MGVGGQEEMESCVDAQGFVTKEERGRSLDTKGTLVCLPTRSRLGRQGLHTDISAAFSDIHAAGRAP